MLAISALTQRGRTAGIVWIVALFSLSALGRGLSENTGIAELEAVSFTAANTRFFEYFFLSSGSDLNVLWFGLTQVTWALLGCGAVLIRLRRFRSIR